MQVLEQSRGQDSSGCGREGRVMVESRAAPCPRWFCNGTEERLYLRRGFTAQSGLQARQPGTLQGGEGGLVGRQMVWDRSSPARPQGSAVPWSLCPPSPGVSSPTGLCWGEGGWHRGSVCPALPSCAWPCPSALGSSHRYLHFPSCFWLWCYFCPTLVLSCLRFCVWGCLTFPSLFSAWVCSISVLSRSFILSVFSFVCSLFPLLFLLITYFQF